MAGSGTSQAAGAVRRVTSTRGAGRQPESSGNCVLYNDGEDAATHRAGLLAWYDYPLDRLR